MKQSFEAGHDTDRKSVRSGFSAEDAVITQIKFNALIEQDPKIADTIEDEPSVQAQGLTKKNLCTT